MKHIYLSQRHIFTFVVFSFIGFFSSFSQQFTSSNLPIVIIDTDNGAEIPDDPRIFGTMKIIKRPDGSRNFVSDANNEDYLDYSGTIDIETRGSTSQGLPKKPYGFSTLEDDREDNDNVSLLGMPKENDWILNSFAYDDSMMRDFISYTMSNEIGQYATRLQYCEVVINGDYRGLYALSEKIKRDDDRVNIAKLSDDENEQPKITGGYIMKSDKLSDGEEFAWSSNGANYIHHRPKPEDITSEQSAYIETVFRQLDQLASNPDNATGYPSVIDVPTFVDYMLLAEIASNVDSYQFSTFYHKDRNGKLRAGPIWDYNLTYGNDLFRSGYDRSHTDVWQFQYENDGAQFWRDLFADPKFKCHLAKRFNEITQPGQPLNFNTISDLIDTTSAIIAEAVEREDQRWNTISDFEEELTNMKNWIQTRITWMRENLGEFSDCAMINTPSLVISKIHYHPEETDAFPESDDQEFIEIRNIGPETANLSGFYFGKLGISFQFPENSTLTSGAALYLVGDENTFREKYDTEPFGRFTRDLSNKSQNLVLADPFGNVVDQVEYKDSAPWPETADGDGFYLELVNLNSDNSMAENWKASAAETLTVDEVSQDKNDFVVFPNPSQNKFILKATEIIKNVEIFNVLGQRVSTKNFNATSGEMNVANLQSGVYILNLEFTNGKKFSQQIVKR